MTTTTNEPATVASKPSKKPAAAPSASSNTIVLDMGSKTRKQIRKLRKGKSGRLMNRVEEAISHLRENGALTEGAQPIVIVVKQKARRRGGRRMAKMWGLG